MTSCAYIIYSFFCSQYSSKRHSVHASANILPKILPLANSPCLLRNQGTTPKCPMCQAVIQLEVKWRFPLPRSWRRQEGGHGAEGHPEDLDGAGDEGGPGGGGMGGGDGGELLVMNPNDALNPDDLQVGGGSA